MSNDDKSIDQIITDSARIDRAARRAVREAVRKHKLLGNPVAVWKGGRVVLMPPEEIVIQEEDDE